MCSRPTRIFYANVALYGSLAILAALYRSDLAWAARALPAYVAGGFPPLLEVSLFHRALGNMQTGGDPAHTKELLERSLAIDPISPAAMPLAESYLAEGRPERALAELRRHLELDPSDLHAYVRAAQIYQGQGREVERRQILEQGLAYFRVRAERLLPHYDGTVDERYNRKAQRVYEYYQEAIGALEARL